MKKLKKNQMSGITLIALVVTIIVLLILAGISIQMLTGDNGILTQTTQAKEETRGGQVQDERDLWKLTQTTDKYSNTTLAESLDALLERLGPNNQKLLTALEVEEVKTTGKVKIGSRTIEFGLSDKIKGVDFGEKDAKSVVEGDTICIGEEQFMVLKNDGNSTIMALPYYNLSLKSEPIVQLTAEGECFGNDNIIAFCDSSFWGDEWVNIEPMSNTNIQQYITAYSEKLSEITDNHVIAEVGRKYGVNSLIDFEYRTNENNQALLNPGGCGWYWLGSGVSNSVAFVSDPESDGFYIRSDNCNRNYGYDDYDSPMGIGVRPVIYINY